MPKTLKQHAIDIANAFTRWGLWQGGGASALADLEDVALTQQLADGDVLQYNGSEWVNAIMQGGGSVGAQFTSIDTDNIIAVISGAKEMEYTATENCYFYKQTVVNGTNASESIHINGVSIGWTAYTSGYSLGGYLLFPLSKGDTIRIVNSTYESWAYQPAKVFGVKQSFSLHEYSTEEKVVGKWIDGKPLYQISIVGSASGTNSTEVNTNFNCAEIALKKVNLTIENNNYGGYTQNSGVYYVHNNNLVVVQTLTASNIIFRYNIIVEYTKKTD